MTTFTPTSTTTSVAASETSTATPSSGTTAPASSTNPTASTSVRASVPPSNSSQTTFSSSSASASTRMSSNPPGALLADSTGFKVGVSFGALAALGFLAAFLLWWIRQRQRRRTRKLGSSVAWPWEKQAQNDLHGSPTGLETGFGATPAHGDSADLWSAGCLHGLDAVSPIESRLPSLPQTAHTSDTAPYQTVQHPHANNSVPDLAPNMGVLQVTNLVPGDISSGTESSRASSVLSMTHMPLDCGTPYEPSVGERPLISSVQEHALCLPWPSLYVRNKPAETQRLNSSSHISEKSLGPLPYPGDALTSAAPPSSWAASIRANIVHALHTVVKAPSAAQSVPDNLTSPPRRRQRGYNGEGDTTQQYDPGALSRDVSICSSISNVKEDLGNADNLMPRLEAHTIPSVPLWSSIPLDDNPAETPHRVADVADNKGPMDSTQEDSKLDFIEDYYSRGAMGGSESPHTGTEEPPRLPDILRVSHTPSLSSLAIVCEARAQRKSTKYKKGGTRRKTRGSLRPALVTRASSLCSVGSDMSRRSSKSSQHLTDAEAMAKRALRERRRRVLEMGTRKQI